jgi:hypothetical protein
MSDIRKIIADLLGKIFLTKKTMFGLDEQQIVLIISPSLKIFDITSRPQKLISKFPFEKNRILVTDELKKWAKDNGYNISFTSTVPSLNRRMMREFGDVMVEEVLSKEKELHILVLEELEKSDLPETIKKWAKENPEKFVQNLRDVEKLLKK